MSNKPDRWLNRVCDKYERHTDNPLKVIHIDKNIAKDMVIKNHYTHRWTSCRVAYGLTNPEQDHIVGVAVYGFPVGRRVVNSISPLLYRHNVLELTRLWVNDSEGKNTESYFLGQTFKHLRKMDIKVLIAYSDPMHSHVGFVYQATNWIYQGNNTMLVKGHLHVIHGEELHPRTVFARYGTVDADVLRLLDPGYRRIELKKKHRYIHILAKGRERKDIFDSLKYKPLPYPKANVDVDW